MVPIFTYRDERKLFAIISGVFVAALIIGLQIFSARTGKPNPISITVNTVLLGGQVVLTTISNGVSGGIEGIMSIPRLWSDNAALRTNNRDLEAENTRLREELATKEDAQAIERIAAAHPHGILANTIGYDPENTSRIVSIDRGSLAGIRNNEGVINDVGVVGRVIQVTPFSSRVLLITDPADKVPAVVQRGRWWGIATGTNGKVQIQYISQDAQLRIGDLIVTGEGLSFHAGLPIGRITKIFYSEGALYQTALVEPSVAFGRLGHVLVVPK